MLEMKQNEHMNTCLQLAMITILSMSVIYTIDPFQLFHLGSGSY